MSFQRTKVQRITIHYHEKFKSALIEDIIKESPVVPTLEPNQNGYFGVHYVLGPILYDIFYETTNIKPFLKFELQLRTLLQHAWSEVQHKVIYKPGSRPDYSQALSGQFAMLAGFLNTCDSMLDGLSEPLQQAPSYQIGDITHPPEAVSILKLVQGMIKEFESRNVAMAARFSKVSEFISTHQGELQRFSDTVTNDNASFNAELAELYLKSEHYEEAYGLYHKVLSISNFDGWVLLRLAETCDGMVKEEETIKHTRELAEVLKARIGKIMPRDDALCAYGSVLAWKYNLMESAIELGERAIDLTPKDSWVYLVRRKLNVVYYYVDLYKEKDKGDVSR